MLSEGTVVDVVALTAAVVVVVVPATVVVTGDGERVSADVGVPARRDVSVVTSARDVTADNVEAVGGLGVVADVTVTSSRVVVGGLVTFSGNGGVPPWAVTADQADTAQLQYKTRYFIFSTTLHGRYDHGNGIPSGNGNPMGFPW